MPSWTEHSGLPAMSNSVNSIILLRIKVEELNMFFLKKRGIKWLAYTLRKLNAFHCNIKGGWIFVPGIHPPPLKHLNCFRLPLCPRWRTIKLEPKFTVDIHHTICTNNLEDIEQRNLKIKKAIECNKVFLSATTNITFRNAQAIFLNPRSCSSTSMFALASSIEMKSRILSKHSRRF